MSQQKKWRLFFNFVYWGQDDAVKGIGQLETKMAQTGKEKDALSLNALQCLQSVWLPIFHTEVAQHLLRTDATVKSLAACVQDIKVRQWVFLHVRHPQNKLLHRTIGVFLLRRDRVPPRSP